MLMKNGAIRMASSLDVHIYTINWNISVSISTYQCSQWSDNVTFNRAHLGLSTLPQLLPLTASSPLQPTMWPVSDRFSRTGHIESLATPLVPVWHLKSALSCRPRVRLWNTFSCVMDPTPMWQHTQRYQKKNQHTHIYTIICESTIWSSFRTCSRFPAFLKCAFHERQVKE